MPRACPVESHDLCYLAGNVNLHGSRPWHPLLLVGRNRCRVQREPPRLNAVASSFAVWQNLCSVQREPPRLKAVASSFAGWQNLCSVQREPPRGKPVASSTFAKLLGFSILLQITP